MYVRSRDFRWAIAAFLFTLAPYSLLSPEALLPAIAQTTPKQKAGEVKGKPIMRWEGTQVPTVQMLKGKQAWIESVQRVFQGGIWTFYSDGKFVFTASPNTPSTLFPITGTYTQRTNEIQFQAEKQSDDTKVALDGTIRGQGKTATLEILYTVSGPFAQEVAQISQGLSPASSSSSQTAIQGIPVPSIFEISLQGKTDNQSFGPLIGKLQITTPSKLDFIHFEREER